MTEDLGDARSRLENQRFRDLAQRTNSTAPEYAYAPRWVPMGRWRMDIGDVIVAMLGCGILLMAVVLHWLGYY